MPNAAEFKRRLLEIKTGAASDGAASATARGATPPGVAAVDTASAQAPSASGPTILSNPIEICVRDARHVPADSRSAVLRRRIPAHAPGELASSRPRPRACPIVRRVDSTANRHGRRERRLRRRHPLRAAIIIVAVLALLFGLRVLSAIRNANTAPEERERRTSASHGARGRAPAIPRFAGLSLGAFSYRRWHYGRAMGHGADAV